MLPCGCAIWRGLHGVLVRAAFCKYREIDCIALSFRFCSEQACRIQHSVAGQIEIPQGVDGDHIARIDAAALGEHAFGIGGAALPDIEAP